MKIIDLLAAQPALDVMENQKMPAKLAYALAKNIRLINQELEIYDQARLKLLAENWTLDIETNKYDIPNQDQEKWRKMHEELIETEVDYQPYKVDLSLCENIEMTPVEMLAISWMIEDGTGD